MKLGSQPSSTHKQPRHLAFDRPSYHQYPPADKHPGGVEEGVSMYKMYRGLYKVPATDATKKPVRGGGERREERENQRNQHTPSHRPNADKAGRHADQEPTTDVGTVEADKVSRAGPSNFASPRCGDDQRGRDWPGPAPLSRSPHRCTGYSHVPNDVRAGQKRAVMGNTLHSTWA